MGVESAVATITNHTDRIDDQRDSSLDRPPSGEIQVIRRCAQVLRLFTRPGASVTAAAVAAELRLQRSTVHRYLSSLERAGLVERQVDGTYTIGALIVQLGAAGLGGQPVLDVAGPYMRQLSEEARETVVMSVWQGSHPVVARVHEFSDRLVQMSVRVGSALPLDSAQAQVFLAYMDRSTVSAVVGAGRNGEGASARERIRAQGFAVNTRGIEGTRTVAVPVFHQDHEVCATLAYVGTISAISAEPDSPMALALIDTATQISTQLGAHG